MADPQLAHSVDIHITATSATALDSTNKLEENTSAAFEFATTVVKRNLLNSDGWEKASATTHAGTGTLEGFVIRGSAAQETMTDAESGGTTAYLHVIHTPAATVGQTKGHYYPVVFESYSENFAGGELVSFSASFTLNGAPVAIVAA
ncbi:MAG: hypothetical protein JXB05_24685 [Myxococcaceae bacterium]|nr:hypothetical protein [Myxococcaceae bacterium]